MKILKLGPCVVIMQKSNGKKTWTHRETFNHAWRIAEREPGDINRNLALALKSLTGNDYE